MKQNLSNLLLAIVAMAAFNSCSSDDAYTGKDIPGSKLMVSGAIQQQQTRVSGTTWDDGDAIGIHDGALARNVNVKYLASNSGAFTPAGSDIYVLGGDEVTFNAYYPYSENVTADQTAIAFDAASGDNVDFLWATTTASREMPSAAFLFSHKMSKMNITIDGTGHTANAEMTVSLKGVATGGSFETTTGVVTANAAKGSITASGKFGQAVSFILPPVSAPGNVEIAIMVEDKYYQGTFNPSLNASAQVNYTIDLSTADEKNNITVSSGTITDWTTSNGGSIVVTETEAPMEENAVLEVGDFYLYDGTTVDYRSVLSASVKAQVAGVVFYVGNAQPSALYGEDAANDLLLKNHAGCTHGLVISKEAYPAKGAHWLDKELAGGAGLMFQWFTDNNIAGVYGSRYAVVDGVVSSSKADSKGENNMLGYNNTELWRQFAAAKSLGEDFIGLEQLNAFAAANPLPATTSGWYVPSLGEMKTLVPLVDSENKTYEVVPTLAASFAKLGDDTFLKKSRYWTSTEGRISSDKASTMAVTFWKSDAWAQSFSPTANATTGWFHFAFAF